MNIKKLDKLRKMKNFDLISFIVPIIDFICPVGESPNRRYDNKYFLICMLDFVQTRVSWRKYKGTHECPIDGKYLNKIHNKWVKENVYTEIEKQVKNKYLKYDKEHKLKCQMIDSSFIANKGGSVKNNNHLLSDEEKKKNKKYVKIIKIYQKKNKKKKERLLILIDIMEEKNILIYPL